MKKLLLILTFISILFLAACGGGYDDARGVAHWTGAAPMATPAPVTGEAFRMRNTLTIGDEGVWNYGTLNLEVQQMYTGYAFTPIAAAIETPPVRMLIQRATVEMASYEFSDIVTKLRNAAASFGGYVESSSLSQTWSHNFEVQGLARILNITMRVPVARFDEALRHVEGYGDVISLHQTTDDVTGQFFDIQRRMETMMVQEDRLLELVDEAANLQQLFQIEDRLNEVRTQIELYRGSLEGLGERAAFSTITVILWELLHEPEEDEDEEEAGYTFWQRVGNAFNASVNVVSVVLQGLVIFLAAAIIPLLILAPIAAATIVLVKWLTKRARARAAANPPKYAPYYAPYYAPQQAVQTPDIVEEAPEAEEVEIKDEASEES